MNIEEIKKRVARLEYFRKESEKTAPIPAAHETGARQTIVYNELRSSEKIIESYAIRDVPYLLSIIEQAEKALEEVYECGSIKQAEIISGKVLQVIRGK